MAPRRSSDQGRSDLGLYRRLLLEARSYWPHICALFLLQLVETPLVLLTPLPLKIAVDSVIGNRPMPRFLEAFVPGVLEHSKTGLLVVVVLMVLVIAFLARFQGLTAWVMEVFVGEKLVLTFRAKLLRSAQRLSLAFHDTRGVADSTYRLQYDAPAIQNIAIYGVLPFVTSGIKVFAMIYVIARLEWRLGLVAAGISPILFWLARFQRKRLRQRWKQAKELQSSAMAVVHESLSAVRVIKAFGQEDREHDRYVRHASESLAAQIRVNLAQSSFSLMVGMTIAVGTAGVLYVGVSSVVAGSLTLGNLLLIMGYIGQFYGPLKTIGRKIGSVQGALASAERAFVLMDEKPDVVERPGAKKLLRARGAIEFRDVAFSYESGQEVLSDICFSAPAGSRVGIAGPTGAGKTTLLSLLPRFYDPTGGQILLDGRDLRDIRLADLRDQFSIVLQDTILFSTSIRENIAYGRPEASQDEIVAASMAAEAHTFILGLPEGYDTQVGERGMRLSGGERQRIAIARAFLKNAPILLLDEPTSSVDVKTESGIMKALERLIAGRTAFIIAHRLSTLEHCDLRFEIHAGRLQDLSSTRSDKEPTQPASGGLA